MELDNQQATSFELGWLVGILDGEGAIGITRRNRATSINLKPYIQMANCDKSIIDRYCSILKKLNIPHYISYQKPRGRVKECWQVGIAGLKRTLKLLPLVQDSLTGVKRRKANLVREYCESRLSDWHAAPLTERQIGIFEKVSELNSRGTKRKPASLRDYTRKSRSSKFPKGIRYSPDHNVSN